MNSNPTSMASSAMPNHYRQPLLQTPFHNRARALSQHDSFVAWAGYTTVDVFTTPEQEYFSVRNATGVFDLTPMVKYRVVGAGAAAYLNHLVTRDVSKLKLHRVMYVVWCNDDGHIIDDGTIFRLGEDEYWLCTAERQIDWLLDAAIGYDVEIAEVTAEVAALAVQGPTSCWVLKQFGLVGVELLKPFELGYFNANGIEIMASRTGFTGDLGYEIWMAPEDAETVWDRLMEVGRTRGIRAIGSQALNALRIEAGFLMPHYDFISSESTIRLGRDRSPLELGFDWLIDFKKGHFNGRRALMAEQASGVKRRLVGLDISGNKAAHSALLYSDKAGQNEVGNVTSAMWSPTCKRNIALAIVNAPHFAIGATVWAEIYLNRELVWERRMVQAKVVEKPFFAPERRRVTPPADR